MYIVGIDLGTTNSLISCWKDGRACIIPNILGNTLTPSVVGVGDQGDILIGEVARERLVTHPSLTASEFKRFMGTDKKYKLGKYMFSPEELSSFVLKSLKEDAEVCLGEEVSRAVISVPAYFNDTQRKATEKAAELAGLKVERLISEPTAAALAYEIAEKDEEAIFLVFDLGGGTFDVSVVDYFEGVAQVKAVAGDNYLGGKEFDEVLVTYFLQQNDLSIEDLDIKTISNLKNQAQNCKKHLSESYEAMMKLNYNGKVYEIKIDRAEFEKICATLMLRLRQPIERVIRDAGLTVDQIDKIVLIGGSTKMPIIKSVVSKIFNQLPFTNINADEAVVMGTSVQVALKEKSLSVEELILTDVCPYTVGIELDDKKSGYFLPIIERNSPIPISRIVEDLVTVHDGQKEIRINVYQGESINLKNNIKIGSLEIPITPAPAGVEGVNVRFTYDINGLLEVEVTSVTTKQKKNIVIERHEGLLSDEEIKARLEIFKSIKIHPRDKVENQLIIARGERLFEESLGEKREYISHLIRQFKKELATQDLERISRIALKVTEKFDVLEKEW